MDSSNVALTKTMKISTSRGCNPSDLGLEQFNQFFCRFDLSYGEQGNKSDEAQHNNNWSMLESSACQIKKGYDRTP